MRNSSLVEWFCADNSPGLKPTTEATGRRKAAVGERSVLQRSRGASRGGADGRANAGMSSVNLGEKPGHRKPKVSYGRLIRVGLVGPKPRAKAVGDGQLVSIPAPLPGRFKAKG